MTYRYPGRITFFEHDDGRQTPMRSRLEIHWAVFFTAARLVWEYEPQTFRLSNEQYYTPDFYLPEVGWIEIKATWKDARAAENKLRLFARERHKLIGGTRRKEFYTICADQPELDIHGFHRWDPEPEEIHWAKDIYLLFCGTETTKTAQSFGVHPVEWLKHCLSKGCAPIDPLRNIEEYNFAYRHHELGTSFHDLSRAIRNGRVLPLTNSEIAQLRQRRR